MITEDEARSESQKFLKEREIHVIDHLPFLEAIESLTPQNSKAVATRIVILSCVIGIGYGANSQKLREFLEKYNLRCFVSDVEKALVSKESHTPQEKLNAQWLAEAVQGLAWCLGLVDLNPFNGCDSDLASHFPKPFVDPTDFIESSRLRPFEDIYKQADLYYCLHWNARNSRLTGQGGPLKESIILERRKALDWVIGVEADWDEITLDT